MSHPHRPSDADALTAVARRTRAATGLPVVFGGLLRAGAIVLDRGSGRLTDALGRVAITPTLGLGGVAWARRSGVAVADYVSAESISHEFDPAVVAERMTAVAVAPVLVRGRVRGLLYGATRGREGIGGTVSDALHDAAAELARELEIRDEVDRRVALLDAATTGAPAAAGPAAGDGDEDVREELRWVYAQLRALAHGGDDAELRPRLAELADRPFTSAGTAAPRVTLTARQLDVLALVALGCANAEIARRLGLSADTVKNYLRAAMARLGTGNRWQAVLAARRAGLLP